MLRRSLLSIGLVPVVGLGSGLHSRAIATLNSAGVSFLLPAEWEYEDDADGQALFMHRMTGPNEVEAAMFIELFTDVQPLAPMEGVKLAIERAKAAHPDYYQLDIGTRALTSGLRCSFVRYEVRRKGSPFVEQFVVVPVAGSQRVNIYSFFDRSLSERYLPVVESFLQSLRITT